MVIPEALLKTPPTPDAAPAAAPVTVTPRPAEQPAAPIVAEKPTPPPERTPPPAREPILVTTEPRVATSASNEVLPTTPIAETTSDPIPPVEPTATSSSPAVESPSVQTSEPQVTLESPTDPAPKKAHGSHDGHDHGAEETHHAEEVSNLTEPFSHSLVNTTDAEKTAGCGAACGGGCGECPVRRLGGEDVMASKRITFELDKPPEELSEREIAARDKINEINTGTIDLDDGRRKRYEKGEPISVTIDHSDHTDMVMIKDNKDGTYTVTHLNTKQKEQSAPAAEAAPAKPEPIVETVLVASTSAEPAAATPTTAPERQQISSTPSVTNFGSTEQSIATTSVAPTETTPKSASNPEPVITPASPKQNQTVTHGEPQTRQERTTRIRADAPPEEKRNCPEVIEHIPTEGTPVSTTRGQERNSRRRVEAGAGTDTPKTKQDSQHATTRRESFQTKPNAKDKLRTIIYGKIPQQQTTESSHTSNFSNGNKDTIAAKIREAVPAKAAELGKQTRMEASQVFHDMTSTITSAEQHGKRKTTERRTEGNKKQKISLAKGEAFASIIISEIQKPEKRKRRKRKIDGKSSAETVPLQKRRIEKAVKLTARKRKGKLIEMSRAKSQEKQTRQRRSILTEATRAKIYERMKGKKRAETAPIKTKQEIFKIETTRPLILMIPKQTPVEHIAGAIILIAKEKRTKEGSPRVQLVVSEKAYRALKKLFTEAIESKSTKQTNSIEIICGNKKMTLDVEKIKLLEHLFTDFEAQFLLLQLRQCLIQSEIKEATVLCGCQQQNAATTFEKISFCQGCHQGYLQQTFFWLITILWYTIYEMTLDQKQNQLYTQSYSYEQTILTS